MRDAAVPALFDAWLSRWSLVPDGAPIATHCSDLLPVRRPDGEPAMLKVAREDDTRWGWLLLQYWDGEGAAHVLAHEGDALLLERATGARSLARMTLDGHDDEAVRILCASAARLHAPRPRPLPSQLVPLSQWFEPLAPVARAQGGLLARAEAVARELLATPREPVTLHGDLHHDNVLDGGGRGWLAIDPLRLYGERCFDFANLLRNPIDRPDLARRLFARRTHLVAVAAEVERAQLLRWTLAFAALSAAWIIGDGDDPADDLAIAELALSALP